MGWIQITDEAGNTIFEEGDRPLYMQDDVNVYNGLGLSPDLNIKTKQQREFDKMHLEAMKNVRINKRK